MTQKWKNDAKLHSCERIDEDGQQTKSLDYYTTYKDEFLEKDPIRDWESIERCKDLWYWFFDGNFIPDVYDIHTVLDVGTKDGQFVEWLENEYSRIDPIGIEISDAYVEYAMGKGRNVVWGDVCNLEFSSNSFDVVFAHHVLGLAPNYKKAMEEMYRVARPGGYVLMLNDIPGNKRKHYSYIDSIDTIRIWLTEKSFAGRTIEYFDKNPNEKYPKEKILLLRKGAQK